MKLSYIKQGKKWFIIFLIFSSCESEQQLLRLELDALHDWEVLLSGKWSEIGKSEMDKLVKRGNALVKRWDAKVDGSGFREIISLEYEGSKLFVVIGQIDEEKYGPYEIARQKRAEAYKRIYQDDIITDLTMKERQINLGALELVNYNIRAVSEKLPIINLQQIFNMRLYEGKLNQHEFILISSVSKDEKIDKALTEMILSSKIIKKIH